MEHLARYGITVIPAGIVSRVAEPPITFVGVVLFAALTAYDTQRLKALFESETTAANLPLAGALTLYLDFINMFLFLLRLFGNRRRD